MKTCLLFCHQERSKAVLKNKYLSLSFLGKWKKSARKMISNVWQIGRKGYRG
jgi:hypothetical protein